jgi:hypothetical protein
MTQRDNILQELNELESSLANASPSTIYRVPGGYFEGLAGQIMSRIRAMEADNAGDELAALSPFLDGISRETPYRAPLGYFDGLEKKLMEGVLKSDSDQSAEKELESLSPLLSGIKKEMPYSVPEGYFNHVTIPTHTRKKEAKVVSLTSRKWFRYAAAAVVTGFVALGGFLIFGNNKSTTPQDIVKQTVNTVSEKDINSFIELGATDLMAEEAPELVASAEVKDLVKALSDKEIQDFVNDTQVIESDITEDIILN